MQNIGKKANPGIHETMQIGREGKNYFLKILPVKIHIHEHKRLEMSCVTAILQVGKRIGKNVMRIIQFSAFKGYKSIKMN